jgi:hypothetical protein
MGGNEKHPGLREGTAVLQGGPLGEIVLQKVLFVPGMIHNIVSNAKVTKSGRTVEMLADGLTVRRPADHAPVLHGSCEGGMYVLHAHLQVLTSTQSSST